MANRLKCVVCGNEYDACTTCSSGHLSSWKTVTDTSNHFNIYLIVNDFYNKVITKEEAKELLNKCDITGYEDFNKNVAIGIKNIIHVDSTTANVKKKRENKKQVND